MKIVILDSYTCNPGDLSWSCLEQFGQVEIYPRTKKEDTVSRIGDAEIIVTNKTIIDRMIMDSCRHLKLICVSATGYNVIDVEAAKDFGILVCNTPAYSTDSVAQLIFAHILAFCNKVESHSSEVSKGLWSQQKDFCFWLTPQIELANKTIGFVGFGKIGQKAAEIASAFGMNILAYDLFRGNFCDQSFHQRFQYCSLEELLHQADFISLNCPLTEENKYMINTDSLTQMKPTAFLLNTSRGPLVNEADLAQALNNGTIAGAGLDVLGQEPPAPDNPLLLATNITITPHIAWASKEARQRLILLTRDNIEGYLHGKPIHVVNP